MLYGISIQYRCLVIPFSSSYSASSEPPFLRMTFDEAMFCLSQVSSARLMPFLFASKSVRLSKRVA